MKKTFYENKLETAEIEIIKIGKIISRASILRLLIFALVIACLSVGLVDHKNMITGLGVILFIVFMLSIVYHNRLMKRREKLISLANVCDNYLKRFNHTWQDFNDRGEQFIDDASFIALDLDIIGRNSLFQYINLAKSNKGQQRLFERLTNNVDYSNEQDAITELAQDKELHLTLSTLINMYDNKKSDLFLNDGVLLKPGLIPIYSFLAYIYPIISIIAFTVIIFGLVPLAYLAIVILINLIIFLIGILYNRKYLSSILTHNSNLEVLIEVLKETEDCDFKSEKLKKIKQQLSTPNKSSVTLKKLVKLNEKVKSQSNFLTYLFANILIQWDYRNVIEYHKWKTTVGKDANKYIDILFELEVLLSLGVIEQTKELISLPTITYDAKPSIITKEIYHPLLNSSSVITNNFDVKAQEIIITGSNMSGKTTFIRSVGINLVLAYAGASVCATNLEATYMKIFTSIRVEDDFNQGISTFYAEIKRIKEMIEYLDKEEPMFCLIDEIFKGTNSEDRIYGAKEAIKSLNKDYIIALITTHDAQLCELSNIVNYHFEEYYENDEIKFDYKIHDGKSQTRNAKYLLKLAGIVNS